MRLPDLKASRLLRATLAFAVTFGVGCGDDKKPSTTDTRDTSDTSGEVSPDVEPDTTPDVEPDTTPDVEPDTTPDVEPDTTPDVEPDTTDVGPDTADTADVGDTVEPPSGESCRDPRPFTLPTPWNAAVAVTGDTTALADDHEVDAGVCPGLPWVEGAGANDEVWSFTAPSAGVYRFRLESTSKDLGVYVLTSCPENGDPTCAGGADFIGVGANSPDIASAVLEAGQTVFVVVDAYTDDETAAVAGPYVLSVAPPMAVAAGDLCSNALTPTLEAATGDYTGAGDFADTTNLTDNYDGLACGADPELGPGTFTQDQVWRFTAPAAGSWDVTVTPTGDADPLVYAFTGACDLTTCVGTAVDVGLSGEADILNLPELDQDEVVFVVVDAWAPQAGGAYDIRFAKVCEPTCDGESCNGPDGCGGTCGCDGTDVCNTNTNLCEACVPTCAPGACGMSDGCGGTCGCGDGEVCDAELCVDEAAGNTCATAKALDVDADGVSFGFGDLAAVGITDTGDNTGCDFLDGGFPASGDGTPDEHWSFTAPTSGRYLVTLTNDPATDHLVRVYEGTSCATTSCLGYVDNGGEGEVDSYTYTFTGGETYTLAVDTWTVDSAGAYLLEVEKACDPTCTPGVCGGDDGCGGICGCGAGESCNAGVCELAEGDTCERPFTLTADVDGVLGGLGDLASSAASDNYDTLSCDSVAGFQNDGEGTPDQVFVFDIAAAGTYTVAVESDTLADVYFALFEGDLCTTATCLGQVDNGAVGETDTHDFDLEVGTYTIVVDTFDLDAAGVYLVTVAPASCVPQCTTGSCADDGCGQRCPCADNEACDTATDTCECVPTCAPGSCGDDGCGGTCACGAGETCDGATDLCVEAPGASCEAAIPYALGTQASGTTVGSIDAQDGLSCPGGAVSGAGQLDLTHRVSLPLPGDYTFTLTPSGGADLSLYALAAGAETCLDQCLDGSEISGVDGVETIDVNASAPGAAYLVVDGGTAAGSFLLESSTTIQKCAEDLFFSEYLEGASNDKVLEIYNGTGAPVDLSKYQIWRSNNGGTVAASGKIALSGTLADGATWVICHASAQIGLRTFCNQTVNGSAFLVQWNGDDYIGLVNVSGASPVVIDAIGVEGPPDPGDFWVVGDGTTANHVLRRLPAVFVGTANWALGATQWQTFPAGTLEEGLANSDFGVHDYFWGCAPAAPAALPNCTINFDATCPNGAAECGATFAGGDCKVIGVGTCYSSGAKSYEVLQATPVTVTFAGGVVNSARVFISGQTDTDAGKIEFFDAAGNSVGVITENGTCNTSEPPRQCLTLTGPAVRATITATSGKVWVDDFETNPASCP